MRWGIAPDDSHYLPAFPFPFYNRLTASATSPICGLSRTCRRCARRNRPTSLGLVAPARGAIGVAALALSRPLAPRPGARTRNGTAAPISSPRSAAAASATRRATGSARPIPAASVGGAPDGPAPKGVPNITPDPKTGIGNWSEDDIVTLLTDGQTPDFDVVGGAMAEIVRNTARLTEADRHAIAVYPAIGAAGVAGKTKNA